MGEYWNIKIEMEITFMNKMPDIIVFWIWACCMSIILGGYLVCG